VTYATTYNPQATVTLTDGSGLANVVVETGNQTSVTSDDYTSVIHTIEVNTMCLCVRKKNYKRVSG
jgi:hypothetical protein